MRDRALRARRWVPSRAAFAENYRRRGNVPKPITRQAGAAASGGMTFSLAPNMLALALATKAFVALATSRWRYSVIVVMSKRASSAARKMKRSKVIHGQGHLTAAPHVAGFLIVESKPIDARRNATRRTKNYLIVLARRTLLRIALVGRLLYSNYPTTRESPAKIPYLIARRHVNGAR